MPVPVPMAVPVPTSAPVPMAVPIPTSPGPLDGSPGSGVYGRPPGQPGPCPVHPRQLACGGRHEHRPEDQVQDDGRQEPGHGTSRRTGAARPQPRPDPHGPQPYRPHPHQSAHPARPPRPRRAPGSTRERHRTVKPFGALHPYGPCHPQHPYHPHRTPCGLRPSAPDGQGRDRRAGRVRRRTEPEAVRQAGQERVQAVTAERRGTAPRTHTAPYAHERQANRD